MKRRALAILSSGALVPHRQWRNLTYLDLSGADLSRAGIPLLSAHDPDHVVGSVRLAWVSDGLLKGLLCFDGSRDGRDAFERLESGAVRGVSVGTDTIDPDDIVVIDGQGRARAFDERDWADNWQDPAAILYIRRWGLRECSLTSRPADGLAIAHPISTRTGG
jgi:phage head maturation protease